MLLPDFPPHLVQFPNAPLGGAGWEQLDIGAAIPRDSSGEKNTVCLRIIQEELDGVLDIFVRQGVLGKVVSVPVFPWHKPISLKVREEIVQSSLTCMIAELCTRKLINSG